MPFLELNNTFRATLVRKKQLNHDSYEMDFKIPTEDILGLPVTQHLFIFCFSDGIARLTSKK